MESLDLTESTLCLKCFRNIVVVMTKGKNKKMKTTKMYLFLLLSLPSQAHNFFSRQNFLKIFFIDTWVSEQRVGKLTIWQS